MTVNITAAEVHNLVHGSEQDRIIATERERSAALIREKTDLEIQSQEMTKELLELRQQVASNGRLMDNLNEQLRESRERVQIWVNRAGDAERRHSEDINTISEMMLTAAEDNELCQVFDDTVEAINRKLHKELTTRVKTYRLTMAVEVEVECTPSELDDAISDVKHELEYSYHRMDYSDSEPYVSEPDVSEG